MTQQGIRMDLVKGDGLETQVCVTEAELFDTELILRAHRRGLTWYEIPVAVREYRAPRTSVIARACRTIPQLTTLLQACLRRQVQGGEEHLNAYDCERVTRLSKHFTVDEIVELTLIPRAVSATKCAQRGGMVSPGPCEMKLPRDVMDVYDISQGRETTSHDIRSCLPGIWLVPMLVFGGIAVTWANVYECKSSSGRTIFTDSPSQLEKCTAISTTPAAAGKKSSYSGSPSPADSNPPTIQIPDLATPAVPEPAFAPSDPSVANVQEPQSQAPPAAPAHGQALNQLHPFLPPVPVAPTVN